MPGSFKTSIAHLISSSLNAIYLSPSQYGKAHDENGNIIQTRRLYRYSLLFKHLQLIKDFPISIVIDGCFDFEFAKNKIYNLIDQGITKEFIFIKCISSDIDISKKRITKRNISNKYYDFVNPNQPMLDELYYYDYKIDSYIKKNKIPFIIYDSCSNKIISKTNTSNFFLKNKIYEILNLLKNNEFI